MSAAYYLAVSGYGVRVVETQSVAGGMLLLGIPRYRLPREVIDREVAMIERLGVEMVEMNRCTSGMPPEFRGPLYVSIDLDAFDPAFAPGVSHPEPGGFDTRTVLGMIQQIRAPLVGADIVELNPSRDPADATARLAAKLLKELTAKMLERKLDGDG